MCRSSRLAIGGIVLLATMTCGGTPTARLPAERPPRAEPWESTLDATHPLVGVVWDVDGHRRASEAELVARLQSSDVVLVGETHDNPDHHRLEARLLAAYAERHTTPAVVFEMLDREQQAIVDATLRQCPDDVDALAQAVGWASSGWPAWLMYRPVFQAAVAANAVVLAGGIGRNAAMRIARDGPASYDPGLDQAFSLHEPAPAEVDAAMRREMGESHCGLVPNEMLELMVLVQRTRDALLAARLHEGASRGGGALLVAGTGHVRRDRGVPAQLARVYAIESLSVGLLEARASAPTPEDYVQSFEAKRLPFDYVWFTPRANDIDHCAELREPMKAPARRE
ncbi:MAG TPA: ChaN family lipoprotein [Polyangiaceae bacterium]|nr:ChaN family lipoprotein [Polyangiaceae bacterium]